MSNKSDLEIFIGANTVRFKEEMQKARTEIRTVSEAARAEATQVEENAEALTSAHARATQRLLRSIDPTLRAVDALEVKQQRLENAFRAGRLSAAEFSRAMQVLGRDLTQVQQREKQQAAALDVSTAAMQRQAQMLKKLNLSQGLYNNAMRQLPMQMTDVVTQLAGGQNPLLILIQQGGQVRDSFGGIRNTFMALRTVISPVALGITALAGTLGVLAYAYYQAANEEQAFNRSLILTGHYAGKTTDELNALSKSMMGDGFTQGKMASVLAQVVGTGAFTGSQLEQVSAIAARMEKATGQSVDETIKQFKRLSQDPVKAAKELDDALHILTASQWAQINTLAEQGRTTEAAKVAMSAYSEAMATRTSQIQGNLGTLETAWDAVTSAAKKAWDAMLDIGRDATLEEKIADLEKKVKAGGVHVGKAFIPTSQADRDALSQLKTQQFIEKTNNTLQATLHRIEEDKKRQYDADRKLTLKYETPKEAHQRALKMIDGDEYASPAAKAQATAREKARYEKSQSAQHRTRQDEASRLFVQAAEKHARLQAEIDQARLSTTVKLTDSEKQLIALKARMSQMRGKLLTEDDKSLITHQRALELALENNAQAEKALRHQNALNGLKKETLQLQQTLNKEARNTAQNNEAELAKMGMGAQQRQDYDAERAIKKDYDTRRDKLNNESKENGTYGSADYQQAEHALQQHLETQLASYRQHQAQMKAAQRDWRNGASRAVQNFASQGQDIAGMTEKAFNRAFQSMGDALGNFVTKGKADFKGLTASILSDLAKMALQMAMSKALGALFGAFAGGAAGASGAGTGAMGMSTGWQSYVANAKGGVYTSASLSRYSGTLVNRPTLFAFAKGAGLMGEAGPEAILPLRRGVDGKLGVVAKLTGGRGDITQHFNFTVHNDGENGQMGPEALSVIGAFVKTEVLQAVNEQQRDGGSLAWRE